MEKGLKMVSQKNHNNLARAIFEVPKHRNCGYPNREFLVASHPNLVYIWLKTSQPLRGNSKNVTQRKPT